MAAESERREGAPSEKAERDPIGAGNAWVVASGDQMDERTFEDAVDEALGVDPQAAKDQAAREEQARQDEVKKRFG